jgi:ubiquinone/menaquinone biosynthesis C-methylase UbiE
MAGDFEPFVAWLLRRHVHDGDTMLDVGCGPATYRRACAGRYVGLDNSDAPLAPDMPRQPDVVAQTERLPFRSGSFDFVMCKSALYLMDDPRAALAECHRVLRPSGRLLVLDYNRRCKQRLGRIHRRAYPGWTQRQLLTLIRAADFKDCRLLSTKMGEMGRLERLLRPPLQELFGMWAIVLGSK